MVKYRISVDNPDPGIVSRVVSALLRGEVVAVPTDTVYGLFAHVGSPTGLKRLFSMKKRDTGKPVPVLVSDPASAGLVAEGLSDLHKALMASFWPGPLTLLLRAKPDLPHLICKDGKIAVRCPDSEVARLICRGLDGIAAATSANLSEQPPTSSAATVERQLGGGLDVLLDAGESGSGLPSTLVEEQDGSIIVLRLGAVTVTELRKVMPGRIVLAQHPSWRASGGVTASGEDKDER